MARATIKPVFLYFLQFNTYLVSKSINQNTGLHQSTSSKSIGYDSWPLWTCKVLIVIYNPPYLRAPSAIRSIRWYQLYQFGMLSTYYTSVVQLSMFHHFVFQNDPPISTSQFLFGWHPWPEFLILPDYSFFNHEMVVPTSTLKQFSRSRQVVLLPQPVSTTQTWKNNDHYIIWYKLMSQKKTNGRFGFEPAHYSLQVERTTIRYKLPTGSWRKIIYNKPLLGINFTWYTFLLYNKMII